MSESKKRPPKKRRARPSCRILPPTSERHFVEDLCASLPSFLHEHGCPWLSRCEVGVGRVIPDLVVALAHTGVPFPDLKPLSVAESVTLALLRQTSIATCSRAVTPGPRATRELLDQLCASNLIELNPESTSVVVSEWALLTEVIAVEAKLRRWREALDQAVEYKRFADRVLVALPDALAGPAVRNEETFRAAGVGLWVLRGKRIVEVVSAPVIECEHDWRRDFVFSRILAGPGSSR